MSKICFIANLFPSKKDPSFGSFVGKNYQQLQTQGNDIVSKVVIDYRASGIEKLFCYIKFIASGVYAISKRNYDFIYFHYLTYSTLCLVPFLLIGRPRYVVNIHGDDLVGSTTMHKVMGFASKLILKKSAAVVVPSSYFKDKLLELYPWYDNERIIVSPSGGVDFDIFRPTISPSPSFFTLGYVSRVDEGKGWQELLEALVLIRNSHPDLSSKLRLNIYGTGAEVAELENTISQNDLSSLVTYYGALEPNQLVDKYSEMDAFVFPTHRESFGLVAVEALACGTPVLASNIIPVNDIVIHGKNGLLFNVKDKNSIAGTIVELLEMAPQEYELMRSFTRQSVRNYRSTEVAQHLANELKERLLPFN